MRTLLTLLMIGGGFVLSPLRAQEQVGVDLLSFSDEVSIEGTAKDALYEKAKDLFIHRYNKSPYYLRMNKNTGSLEGGGVEKIKASGVAKSSKPLLNYKIVMMVRDNGYSLRIKDFYYEEVKKSDKSVKKFLCVENQNASSKKSRVLHNKLKQEANSIAQEVRDEIRKGIYKQPGGDIATSNAATSEESVHW